VNILYFAGEEAVRSKRQSPPTPEAFANDSIFGSPPILPGEDASAYKALLEGVSTDVKPKDIIEKIWIRDVVDLTWEIFRWRRIKKTWLAFKVSEGLSVSLKPVLRASPQYIEGFVAGKLSEKSLEEEAKRIAGLWFDEDPKVVSFLTGLEKQIAVTAVMSMAFLSELERIESVDRLIASLEYRRNTILREVDRRRELAFARSLRAEIQKAEDAEYTVIEPKSTRGKIKDSRKAA